MKKYLNKREKSKKDFNYWCCNSGVHCRACGGVHCIVNSWLLSLKIQSSDVGDDDDDDGFHLKLRKCSLPLQMFAAPVLKTHQIFFIHSLLKKHAAVCMHCHSKVPRICLLISIEINLPFLQFSLKNELVI